MDNIGSIVKPQRYISYNNNKVKKIKGMKNGCSKCMKCKRNIILKNNIHQLV